MLEVPAVFALTASVLRKHGLGVIILTAVFFLSVAPVHVVSHSLSAFGHLEDATTTHLLRGSESLQCLNLSLRLFLERRGILLYLLGNITAL